MQNPECSICKTDIVNPKQYCLCRGTMAYHYECLLEYFRFNRPTCSVCQTDFQIQYYLTELEEKMIYHYPVSFFELILSPYYVLYLKRNNYDSDHYVITVYFFAFIYYGTGLLWNLFLQNIAYATVANYYFWFFHDTISLLVFSPSPFLWFRYKPKWIFPRTKTFLYRHYKQFFMIILTYLISAFFLLLSAFQYSQNEPNEPNEPNDKSKTTLLILNTLTYMVYKSVIDTAHYGSVVIGSNTILGIREYQQI
jgi:hypothetical protein